jgi:iron-sulfur cluster insertion protein
MESRVTILPYSLNASFSQGEATLILTPAALGRLKIVLGKKRTQDPQADPFFRIRVDSGGCSGFQYVFQVDTDRGADDIVFSYEDVTIVVDDLSLGFINGVQVDFVEDMLSAAFQLKNPQASQACGCGNSFTV